MGELDAADLLEVAMDARENARETPAPVQPPSISGEPPAATAGGDGSCEGPGSCAEGPGALSSAGQCTGGASSCAEGGGSEGAGSCVGGGGSCGSAEFCPARALCEYERKLVALLPLGLVDPAMLRKMLVKFYTQTGQAAEVRITYMCLYIYIYIYTCI